MVRAGQLAMEMLGSMFVLIEEKYDWVKSQNKGVQDPAADQPKSE